MIRFCIRGQMHSLKNSRDVFVNRKTGRLFPKKNDKIVAFETAFHAQVPVNCRQRLSGDVAVTIDAFYPSRRQDLDEAIIYDMLQRTSVIVNDRQVKEKHVFWHLDRQNPRVWIQVRELSEAGHAQRLNCE